MDHFALSYSKRVNKILHSCHIPTWFYKHEIYEVAGICTALLITYDGQKQDEFQVHGKVTYEQFIARMTKVKPDWATFPLDSMQHFAKYPGKTMLGWEGRTFYFIRGGNNAEHWTIEKAEKDITAILTLSVNTQGQTLQEEASILDEAIPIDQKHFKEYEDFVRKTINYLFVGNLGEAKPQVRTEPGNEAIEIRDLICQNRSTAGFWKDLKDKYDCSEILFDAKNKSEITRDDLRQVYCYLKPALGLWGFIVCRKEQSRLIHTYNKTLFKNFTQARGVLILTDDDIQRMLEIKMYGRDPSEYLYDRMSDFIRSI